MSSTPNKIKRNFYLHEWLVIFDNKMEQGKTAHYQLLQKVSVSFSSSRFVIEEKDRDQQTCTTHRISFACAIFISLAIGKHNICHPDENIVSNHEINTSICYTVFQKLNKATISMFYSKYIRVAYSLLSPLLFNIEVNIVCYSQMTLAKQAKKQQSSIRKYLTSADEYY